MAKASITGLPREGELFDGKYRIGTVLGIGGMAAVISAKHLGLDEMVAIKMLLPECCNDPAVVERFVQEGKTAIKIRSEHVVRMLDVGVVAGRAYLVMEHLDGKNLDALLRDGGPLAFATAVDFLLQACEAIGEAHALGIIHRDLKPANLFLTHRVDGSPCVKVLDFGISKMPQSVSTRPAAGSHPTLPSVVMGSPEYMSPEQMASAAAADQRSDIWSLGAVLYELVTGRMAFGGATTSEICARVLMGPPVPLVQLRADVPDDLWLVVSRCLEKDCSRRYANVAELARALAPLGTAEARASADSIARVFEGGIEPRSPLPSGVGTIRPTAAEILATGPRRRWGGYLLGAIAALAALGIALAAMRRPVSAFQVPSEVSAGASQTPGAPSTPAPASPPLARATRPASAPPPPISVTARAHERSQPLLTKSPAPVAGEGDDAGSAGTSAP